MPEDPQSKPVVPNDLSMEKMSIPQALELAVGLHQQGMVGLAEEFYQLILDANPQHPDALHFRGVALHQLKRSEEALPLLYQAAELAPTHADIRNNLGNVLRELGRFQEALTAYDSAVAIQPKHADALSNRGIMLRTLGRVNEAMESYRLAISYDPKHAQAHHNLGSLLLSAGRLDEAIASYKQAISIKPRFVESYRRLARARAEGGDLSGACAVLKEWLAFEPDNPLANHLLAACSNQSIPHRASDDYVRTAFDEFASSFDEILDRLHYQGPRLIEQALSAELGEPQPRWEILDAGCGTGLCAPLLKGYAKRLVGVDLSPRMLDQARRTGLYDELIEAELTALLGSRPNAFDLIVVADTFCYFGELSEAFAMASKALHPAGRLVLTVERSHQAQPSVGYHLHQHGRYSHTPDYLTNTLELSGFRVCQVTEDVLRQELGEDVPCMLAIAQKGVGLNS